MIKSQEEVENFYTEFVQWTKDNRKFLIDAFIMSAYFDKERYPKTHEMLQNLGKGINVPK